MMLTTNRTQSNFTLTCRRFLACATAADVLDSKNDQNDDAKKQKEASVTVSADWPSQSYQRKPPKELSFIGKMFSTQLQICNKLPRID